jgi:hypothetical protein
MARASTAAPPTAGGYSRPSPAELAALLPDYEGFELIGQGGMGVVYRAQQKRLSRQVAIKVLPRDLASDPTFAERFAREAQLLARLNHPNIVKIHDFGLAEGMSYLVLEHIDGSNLRQLMAMGRLSPEEALRLVPPICAALQYAHDHGVVHRDVKPENVLIDQAGAVHLADFGIARLIGKDAPGFTLTSHQQRVGTPHYMAPEQVQTPAQVDHRADIFGLGVMLYEMLTGSLPLGRFAPPSAGCSVGPKVDGIVLRCLEHDAARRYQAAGSLQKDIEAAWREGFAAGWRSADERQGNAGAPPGDGGGGPDNGQWDGRPGAAAPRLCWLGIWGFLWSIASWVAVVLLYVPFKVSTHEAGAPPPGPTTAQQVALGFAVVAALGWIGGPVLGWQAIRRITAAAGRLYGIWPAVLAANASMLLVLDVLAAMLFRAVAPDAPKWVGAVVALLVLYLNFRHLDRQATAARRRSGLARE